MRYILILLLLLSFKSRSQAIIHRSGWVIFFDSYKDMHDRKMEVAKWCNDYLAKKRKVKDYVLLNVEYEDTVVAVSYDNLYGNSAYQKIYEWVAWDYTLKGIRISVSDFLISKEVIIRALKFALNHKGMLKRQARRNARKGFYDIEDDVMVKIPGS